jgi:hypothetical protein
VRPWGGGRGYGVGNCETLALLQQLQQHMLLDGLIMVSYTSVLWIHSQHYRSPCLAAGSNHSPRQLLSVTGTTAASQHCTQHTPRGATTGWCP